MIEALLRRDRWLVAGALLCLVTAAWLYTLSGAGMGMSALEMTRHSSMAMEPAPWSRNYALLMLMMWWVMMIAMMLPSAAPAILLAAQLTRRTRSAPPPYGKTACFTSGYLLAWLGFSFLAVVAQWALQESRLISAMLSSRSAALSGGLLVAAGFWQLSPLKQTCLRQCRSPVDFLTRRRRPGNRGALRMGLEHGAWCLGCCWSLMTLLFVGGVMNLYWIVGLAIYVLGEKLLPGGEYLARAGGALLILWGAWLVF